MRPKATARSLLTAIALTAGTALAFDRNLTGVWKTPGGDRAILSHDRDNGTFELDLPGPRGTATFQGVVTGSPMEDEPNEFGLGARLEPVSFAAGDDTTCTLMGGLDARGTLLGRAPGRAMRMRHCEIVYRTICDNGSRPRLETTSCAGTWR